MRICVRRLLRLLCLQLSCKIGTHTSLDHKTNLSRIFYTIGGWHLVPAGTQNLEPHGWLAGDGPTSEQKTHLPGVGFLLIWGSFDICLISTVSLMICFVGFTWLCVGFVSCACIFIILGVGGYRKMCSVCSSVVIWCRLLVSRVSCLFGSTT